MSGKRSVLSLKKFCCVICHDPYLYRDHAHVLVTFFSAYHRNDDACLFPYPYLLSGSLSVNSSVFWFEMKRMSKQAI